MRTEKVKKIIDFYLDNKGSVIPRDRIVTEINIPEDEVILIQRYLGVDKNSDIQLISLDKSGCKLNERVTREWAYKVLGFSEETTSVKVEKTKYASASGEALA